MSWGGGLQNGRPIGHRNRAVQNRTKRGIAQHSQWTCWIWNLRDVQPRVQEAFSVQRSVFSKYFIGWTTPATETTKLALVSITEDALVSLAAGICLFSSQHHLSGITDHIWCQTRDSQVCANISILERFPIFWGEPHLPVVQ